MYWYVYVRMYVCLCVDVGVCVRVCVCVCVCVYVCFVAHSFKYIYLDYTPRAELVLGNTVLPNLSDINVVRRIVGTGSDHSDHRKSFRVLLDEQSQRQFVIGPSEFFKPRLIVLKITTSQHYSLDVASNFDDFDSMCLQK